MGGYDDDKEWEFFFLLSLRYRFLEFYRVYHRTRQIHIFLLFSSEIIG